MKKTLSVLFTIYILSFPIRLLPVFQPFRQSLSRGASIENGLFLMLIGLLLIMIHTRGTLYFRTELLRKSIGLCFSLVGVSVITSLLLFHFFGTLHDKNTLSGSFSHNVYYLLIAVTFYFNANLFETLSKAQIRRLLDALIIFVLALGTVQVLIVLRFPAIGLIYRKLDILHLFADPVHMLRMGRICLTSSEPAGIGVSVGVFLMPYVLSMLITEKNKTRYIVFAVWLSILCFFALSSTVVVALLVNYLVFSLFTIRKAGAGIVTVGLFVVLLFVVILNDTGALENTFFGEQISFLLVEKTTSVDNLSTGYRYTTVVNDMICFLKYPISGVGNGNQGFLYNATMSSPYVAESMRQNYQTINAMGGRYGLIAGGPFVPSFLSGYGCIGLLLLGVYLNYTIRLIRRKKAQMENFFFMYCIACLTFVVEGTVAASIEGNFSVMFVLSLPLMAVHFTDEHEEERPNGSINPRRGDYRYHTDDESARGSASDPG